MSEISNKRIGILGLGMVGSVVHDYFKNNDFSVFFYDKHLQKGSIDEVNKADIVFICVPTPFNKDKNYFDSSIVEEAISYIDGGKVVIIKSTILPGMLVEFQNKYPDKIFLYNPEFLREKHAIADFRSPDRQILGYTQESADIAKEIIKILPDAPIKMCIPSGEAEMIKYASNTFLATKVIFATQIFKLCQILGLDYERVKEGVGGDPRIGNSHLSANEGKFVGYGGKCFPKDMKAFIQFSLSNKFEPFLHIAADDINEKLLKEQKISDPEETY